MCSAMWRRGLWRGPRRSGRGLCGSADGPSVAVVGAGPAGFYFAGSFLRQLPNAKVTVVEAEPVPFGLVRFGVAPDHQEVKNCVNHFDGYVRRADGRLRFRGNVRVGKDVSVEELKSSFAAVVVATGVGAGEAERRLGLPSESDLSLTSRQFVQWYNGHPDGVGLSPGLRDVDTVVIAGMGNVALDMARVLLSPAKALAASDVTEEALEELRRSRVRRVVLVGRRGPLHVAFTIKEFRELLRLPDLARPPTVGEAADFAGLTPDALAKLPRPKKRLSELLLKAHQDGLGREGEDGSGVHWRLALRRNVARLLSTDGGRLEGVVLRSGDGEEEEVGAQLLLTSLGYAQSGVAGLPWDEARGVLPTEADGFSVRGEESVLACGWCARGPRGVIATTQSEAKACADLVAGRLASARPSAQPGPEEALDALLRERAVEWTDWRGWEAIDRAELNRGALLAKPREKITQRHAMLSAAAKGS